MHQVDRSAIVPFTAAAMFDLVADVESYPEFLPGCSAARIHSMNGRDVIASISLAQGPFRFDFRTENRLTPHCRISMTLKEGPFSDLHGQWEFTPLEPAGSKVSLKVRFAFKNRLMDLLLGPPFEALCGRLVDTFVHRARMIHS
jgi:ribosome-associated toxin RatA of RatAB toxin-antitoxin module